MNKVAIITRTKDRPLFLKRAIESVASQTYKDYIHVIINDGGDRDVFDMQMASLTDDQRMKIKTFHREVSSNAPDTIFNESIDYVDSEYVAIHDSDDTWHPEFLQRTIELLDKGFDGVVVRTDKVVEEATEHSIKRLKTQQYLPDVGVISLYRQCIDNQLTPISFIYRRSIYKAIGKYDSSLPVVGDWEFGIRFLCHTEVEYLDPGFALAFYHHRKQKGDNSFAKHNHRKYVTQVANKYLREDLSKHQLGLGYIISDLKYQQDIRHKIIKMLLPNSIISRVKRR